MENTPRFIQISGKIWTTSAERSSNFDAKIRRVFCSKRKSNDEKRRNQRCSSSIERFEFDLSCASTNRRKWDTNKKCRFYPKIRESNERKFIGRREKTFSTRDCDLCSNHRSFDLERSEKTTICIIKRIDIFSLFARSTEENRSTMFRVEMEERARSWFELFDWSNELDDNHRNCFRENLIRCLKRQLDVHKFYLEGKVQIHFRRSKVSQNEPIGRFVSLRKCSSFSKNFRWVDWSTCSNWRRNIISSSSKVRTNFSFRTQNRTRWICFFSLYVQDIWVEIFFWCFMTSLFVHLIGSIVAFQSLRNHKIGRWYGALIFLAGIVTPIVSSTITSRTTFPFCRIRRNEKRIFFGFQRLFFRRSSSLPRSKSKLSSVFFSASRKRRSSWFSLFFKFCLRCKKENRLDLNENRSGSERTTKKS